MVYDLRLNKFVCRNCTNSHTFSAGTKLIGTQGNVMKPETLLKVIYSESLGLDVNSGAARNMFQKTTVKLAPRLFLQ